MYAVLVVMRLFLGMYLSATRIAEDLYRLGKRYEDQVLIGMHDFVEGLFTQIDGVFRSTYAPDALSGALILIVDPSVLNRYLENNGENTQGQFIITDSEGEVL